MHPVASLEVRVEQRWISPPLVSSPKAILVHFKCADILSDTTAPPHLSNKRGRPYNRGAVCPFSVIGCEGWSYGISLSSSLLHEAQTSPYYLIVYAIPASLRKESFRSFPLLLITLRGLQPYQISANARWFRRLANIPIVSCNLCRP